MHAVIILAVACHSRPVSCHCLFFRFSSFSQQHFSLVEGPHCHVCSSPLSFPFFSFQQVFDQQWPRQLCYIRSLEPGLCADPAIDTRPECDVRIPTCYSQVLETDVGIPIVAESDVSPAALHAAADIIQSMLKVGDKL